MLLLIAIIWSFEKEKNCRKLFVFALVSMLGIWVWQNKYKLPELLNYLRSVKVTKKKSFFFSNRTLNVGGGGADDVKLYFRYIAIICFLHCNGTWK